MCFDRLNFCIRLCSDKGRVGRQKTLDPNADPFCCCQCGHEHASTTHLCLHCEENIQILTLENFAGPHKDECHFTQKECKYFFIVTEVEFRVRYWNRQYSLL